MDAEEIVEEFQENSDDSLKDPDYVDTSAEKGKASAENSDSEEIEDVEVGGFDDHNFLKIVKNVGRCLLSKQQTPEMKKKKDEAMRLVTQSCLDKYQKDLTSKQVKRKLDNLKSRLKSKIDRNKTGNKPISLNSADELLMELLDGTSNPSITQLPCKYIIFI